MTPATIICDARADGVGLALSPAGTVKASGAGAKVSRWLSLVREHKAGIIEFLRAECSSNTQSRGWSVQFRNQPPIELVCAPPMTAEEVKRSYPDAIDVVPSTHRPESPLGPLSESERQSVLAWLRSIGERDQRLIDATLEQCNASAEARDYFLSNAGAGGAQHAPIHQHSDGPTEASQVDAA
jgi:hypothetical protein